MFMTVYVLKPSDVPITVTVCRRPTLWYYSLRAPCQTPHHFMPPVLYRLRAMGLTPATRSTLPPNKKYSFVAFAAPPSGSEDYVADVSTRGTGQGRISTSFGAKGFARLNGARHYCRLLICTQGVRLAGLRCSYIPTTQHSAMPAAIATTKSRMYFHAPPDQVGSGIVGRQWLIHLHVVHVGKHVDRLGWVV